MAIGVRRALVALVCALSLAGTAVPRASAFTSEEDYGFRLINAKRVDYGKAVLKEHKAILRIAREHAAQMRDTRVMSHLGFEDRVRRIRAADSGINGYICENVGYAKNFPTDRQAIKAIYAWWRKSDSHNRCMLDKAGYKTRSAAIGLKKSGRTWWATFITAWDSTP